MDTTVLQGAPRLPTRRLDLLDLRGVWPTRAGASAALSTGAKARTRRWSRAIHEAWPDLDGIIYPSSMGGNTNAFALYEKAIDALPAAPDFHRPLSDPALTVPLLAAASALNYALM